VGVLSEFLILFQTMDLGIAFSNMISLVNFNSLLSCRFISHNSF
jgi:hypothetical protein